MADDGTDSVPSFEHAPSLDRLGGTVASMLGYRTEDQAPSLHRGLPSPYLTFIVSLDGPIVTGSTPFALDSGTTDAHELILGGLLPRPAYIFQPAHQAGVQMSVHPLAARALFGASAAELTELAGDASDVVGDSLWRLQDELVGTSSWSGRFDAMSRYLIDRARAAPASATSRPEVARAWRWMIERRGAGRMDELSTHVAMSSRQLAKLFNAELGVPPKTLNRLIRFDATRQQVQRRALAGGSLGLTRIAHERGYYDHAHLVRDFREFAGASPTAWLAEEIANIQAGGHRNGEDLVA